MNMKDFFKREFELLEVKTGFKQYEKILERDTWERDLDMAVTLMVEECDKPPFDIIGIDVKQRIISSAIVEDREFTGLNPRFIRKALATWWNFNKDRYYDRAVAAPEEVTPDPVSWQEREHWLNVWQESLNNVADSVKKVPQLTRKEIEIEGQERPKPKPYPSMPESMIRDRELHDQWIRECHDMYTGKPNENWMPEEEWRKKNQ